MGAEFDALPTCRPGWEAGIIFAREKIWARKLFEKLRHHRAASPHARRPLRQSEIEAIIASVKDGSRHLLRRHDVVAAASTWIGIRTSFNYDLPWTRRIRPTASAARAASARTGSRAHS